MSLPKPVMRGLLASRLKFHLTIGITLSIIAGVTYKYRVAEPRKRIYDEYFKNYDVEKEADDMIKAGVFKAVKRSAD